MLGCRGVTAPHASTYLERDISQVSDSETLLLMRHVALTSKVHILINGSKMTAIILHTLPNY